MSFQAWLYLSLLICLVGVLWRSVRWLTTDIGPEAAGNIVQRAAAALKALGALLFSRRLPVAIRALVRDGLLQLHLLKAHPMRWIMHMLIFAGIGLLVLLHACDDLVTVKLFPDYVSTLNPFFFLRNLLGVMVVAGLLIAMGRRRLIAAQKRVTGRIDRLPLYLLAAITLSGFVLEATQIVSEPLFVEMVADYHGDDDPDEVAALKAIWAKDYHVVFDPPASITTDLLDLGAALNTQSCVDCHTRPTAAFGSFILAQLAKPFASLLNQVRADVAFWHLHYLLCFAGLALLPFSKLFHLVTTPLSLALKATLSVSVPDGGAGNALNRKTRRALALDACTHCGACSLHCSVAPSAAVIANPTILPSEKMLSLRHATHRSLVGSAEADFVEGSFICTECHRCTRICPSGLDLQDLWRAGKADLRRQGQPDLHAQALQLPPDKRFEAIVAGHDGAVGSPATGLAPEPEPCMDLCDDPITFQACVQCAVCTSVCPVVAAASQPDQDPEIGPHLVTNLLRMRQPDLAMASSMVWTCVTCYQCQEQCPQHIRVTDLLYELRNRAWGRLKATPVDLRLAAGKRAKEGS